MKINHIVEDDGIHERLEGRVTVWYSSLEIYQSFA